MSEKEADEKASFLAAFSSESLRRGLDSPQKMTPQFAHEYLSEIKDKRGPHAANKARKHIVAAWNWGYDFIDEFPDKLCPFRKVRPFPVKPQDRYVPPDEDIIKVLNLMTGQDALMVAMYLQTGARKSELFRLTWDDVDLTRRLIRLTDKKVRGGGWRERWMSIDEDLAEVLARWQVERPLKAKNVFMQLADHHSGAIEVGDPFKQRRHFMNRLCERAGVRPFGFHALRHWGAARIFKARGLNEAQMFMGHSRATTTDRYIKSAGLYADKEVLATTISNSPVGIAVTAILQKETASNEGETVTNGQ
ncbi:MAG: site-specific integrase [Deltaproteobacteria bacterium]|nr:site-specific integrase [Deltaproteobacteria bacterium]